MPITSVSSNYSGRLKDLCIADGIKGNTDKVQPMSLTFGKLSSYCAGVQKLVQRYAIMLMTKLGSQKDYPDFGTDFITNLNSGRNVSGQDFSYTFNFASWDVIKEMKTYQVANPEMPLDEQINTATLENYNVVKDAVQLNVRLTTMAGTNIQFIMPLPTT